MRSEERMKKSKSKTKMTIKRQKSKDNYDEWMRK